MSSNTHQLRSGARGVLYGIVAVGVLAAVVSATAVIGTAPAVDSTSRSSPVCDGPISSAVIQQVTIEQASSANNTDHRLFIHADLNATVPGEQVTVTTEKNSRIIEAQAATHQSPSHATSTTGNLSVTVAADPSALARTDKAEGNFTFVERPAITIRAGENCTELLSPSHASSIEGSESPVRVTEQALYQGPIGEESHWWDGTDDEVRVIVAEGAEFDADMSNLRHAVATAQGVDFGVSKADDGPTTIFVTPSPGHRGLAFERATPATVWVNEGEHSKALIKNNAYVHEYIHTRQQFTVTEEMDWFIEASATYYSGLVEADRSSYWAPVGLEKAWIGGNASGAVLTDHDTWDGHSRLDTEYMKGARTLAHIDTHIRNSTNGKQSLLDIVRWMNQQDDPTTYEMFRERIITVTGNESSGQLVDRLVDTPGTVTVGEDEVPEEAFVSKTD